MADIRIIPSIGAINVTGSADFRGTGASSVLFVSGSGNVGIGTADPGSKLHIQGAVKATATTGHVFGTSTDTSRALSILNSNLADASSHAITLGYGASNNNQAELSFYLVGTGSASNRLSLGLYNSSDTLNILGNGSIGIGTISPSSGYKLDIVGSVLAQVASGNVSFVVATNNANGALNAIAGSGLEVATDGTNKNISFRTGVSTRMVISSAGAVKFNTYGSGTNTGTAAYRLSVDSSGNIIEESLGAGAIDGLGSSNYLARWEDTDTLTSSSIYETGGNIGIGIQTPIAKLHVSGASDVLKIEGSGSTITDIQGSQGQLFSVTDSLVGSLMSVNDISGIPILEVFDTDKVVAGTYGQNTLVVTGSSVGIGTGVPTTPLRVQGGASMTGGWNKTTTLAATYPTLVFNSNESKWAGIGYDHSVDGIRIWTNGTSDDVNGTGNQRVSIIAGNVGIGAGSPSYKLDVNGGSNTGVARFYNSAATSTILYYGDTGNTQYTETQYLADDGVASIFKAGSGYTSYGGARAFNIYNEKGGISLLPNNATSPILFATGSSVGIGTTDPATKLQVLGQVRADNFYATDSTTFGLFTKSIYFDNTESTGYYTTVNGLLAFDENFYGDAGYGTGTYDPANAFTTNGGGLLIKNEDGWGALISSQNMRWLNADFATLNVQGNAGVEGDLTVDGIITAKEFHTTFVSASILFQSGSTQFGNDISDEHVVYGNFRFNDNNGSTRLNIGNITGASPYVSKIWTGNYHLTLEASGTSQGQIRFNTGTTSASERMRILESGEVLVGGTSRLNAYSTTFTTLGLHTVAGDYAPILELGGNRTANPGNQNAMIQFYNKTGTTTEVGRISSIQGSDVTSGSITFNTNDGGTFSEKLRIQSDGNIGIGTNSAISYKLTILPEDQTGGDGIFIQDPTANNYGAIWFYDDDNSVATLGTLENGSLNEHISLARDTSKVGFGTKTPINRIQVNHTGADSDNGILIVRSDTSTAAGDLLGSIGFDSTDGNVPSSNLEASAFIAAYAAEGHSTGDKGGELAFGTSLLNENDDTVSTEHMRIQYDGNVGIGTINPGTKLDVWNGDLRVSGSTNEQLVLDFAASAGSYTYQSFRLNGTNKYRIFGYTSGDFAIYSDVASSFPLYINSDGNVGINTATPAATLHVDGPTLIEGTATVNKLTVTGSIRVGLDGSTPLIDTTNSTANYIAVQGAMYVLNESDGGYGDIAYTVGPQSYQPSIKTGTDASSTSGGAYVNGNFPNTAADSAGVADATQRTFSASLGLLQSDGARLPRLEEVLSGYGRGTGDSTDSEWIWTQTKGAKDYVYQVRGDVSTYPEYRLVDPNNSSNTARVRRFFDISKANLPVYYDNNSYIRGKEIRAEHSDGLKLYDDGGNGIFIEDGGNVGIGTTGPDIELHVYDADNWAQIKVETGTDGFDASVAYSQAGTIKGITGYDDSTDTVAIKYGTFGGNGIDIKSDGNVGINTTSPGYKLDVVGDARISSNLVTNGYSVTDGIIHHASNINVLNKAGNGWLTWATRNTSGTEAVIDLNYLGSVTATSFTGSLQGNITGTAASETLDTVTGRGATTTNSITTGNITLDNSGTPVFNIYDSGNAGGGGAEGIVAFSNTAGRAIAIGYTADDTTSSDLLISTNAGSTYGGYLGLDSGAISDPDADIILDPKTNVIVSNGSVGIGVGSPSYKLHIDGDAAFTSTAEGLLYAPTEGGTASTRYFIKFDYTNNGSYPFLTNRTPSGDVAIMTGTAAGGGENEHFRIKGGDGTVNAYFTNANVGIGYTSPTAKLHVSGTFNAAFAGAFENDSDSGHGLIIRAGGTSGTRYITQWKDAAGTERFHMHDTGEAYFAGSLGIGVTPPAQPLHVVGNAEIEGNLYVNEYIYHNDDTNTYMRFLGDYVQFDVGGLQFFTMTENSTQDTIVINEDSGDIDFRVESNNNTHLLFTDGGQDRVGINSSDPQAKFFINNDQSWSAQDLGAASSGSVAFGINGRNGATHNFIISSNGTTDYTMQVVASSTSAGDININPYGGGVGIGRNHSGYTVDIGGTTRIAPASGDGQLIITHNENNASAKIIFMEDEVNNYKWAFGYDDSQSNKLFFNAYENVVGTNGSNTVMTLDPNTFHVGIGTDAPTARLNVKTNETGYAGDLVTSVTSGSVHFRTHATDSTITSFGAITGGAGYIQRSNGAGTTSYALTLNPWGGNVGIGVTNPSYKLQVNGTGADSFAIDVASTAGTTDQNAIRYLVDGVLKAQIGVAIDAGRIITDASANDYIIKSWNNIRFGNDLGNHHATITNSGDVGIGITNPSARLHVYSPTQNVTSYFESGDAEAWISLKDSNSGTYGVLLGHDPNANELFKIADSNAYEKLIMTTGGDVSIGDRFQPQARLHVSGASDVFLIEGSGSTLADIQGSQGQLFSVTDSLVGSLMSVNDISGIPILEVFDTDKVVMGTYGQNTLVVTGSNVGIGTAVPTTPLRVQGGASMTGGWNKNTTLAATYPVLILNSNESKWAGIGYDYSVDGIRIWTNATSDDVNGTGSERVSIIGGNVGIGSNSPGYKLTVDNDALNTNNPALYVRNPNSAGSGVIAEFVGDSDSLQIKNINVGDYAIYNTQQNNGINLYDGTGGVEIVYNGSTVLEADSNGGIKVTGQISATADVIAYSSDERLKENIKPIENAVDKVKQLNGVTFDWNNKSEELGFEPSTKLNDVGVIAQEVEKIFPQLVHLAPFDIGSDEEGNTISKSGEDYKTVNYSRLTPVLIEAIKEQQVTVETQQKEIDQLKSELKAIRDMLLTQKP